MKARKSLGYILILVFMYGIFIACALANTPIKNTEFPNQLSLGGQTWTLGYNDEDANTHLGEYVTNGENVNNWTQLVTLQKFKFMFPKDMTPAMFAEKEMEPLTKNPNYKFTFHIIEANAQEAIMEFNVEKPLSEQQDEIQRIIKTADDRLIILHYVIKKLDMGKEARDTWISALKSIKLPFINEATNTNSTNTNK